MDVLGSGSERLGSTELDTSDLSALVACCLIYKLHQSVLTMFLLQMILTLSLWALLMEVLDLGVERMGVTRPAPSSSFIWSW